MALIAMAAFVGVEQQCNMAPVDALKKAKPRLNIGFGACEYARSHEQLVKLSESNETIKEMQTIVVQFG